VPEGLGALHEQLASGAQAALDSVGGFVEPAPPAELAPRVLASLSAHCRAQERLYPLRQAFPALGCFFAEPEWHARLAELDPEPALGVTLGLHRGGPQEGERPRGAFSLYVPERCDGRTPLPLVVALHGGSGHGHDFLWTWLREARSRQLLLLAPSSRGATWSLDAPALDARRLAGLVASVCEGWPVDRSRVLLTGLSDGASFTLLAGLLEDSPFTHLAPVSGVLHPLAHASGGLARARGRRVWLCHGALDWLFPVALARLARDELLAAGADLTYREIEDLSHAYPREENAAILRWLAEG
jgi:phospholipase/carboxylesterase